MPALSIFDLVPDEEMADLSCKYIFANSLHVPDRLSSLLCKVDAGNAPAALNPWNPRGGCGCAGSSAFGPHVAAPSLQPLGQSKCFSLEEYVYDSQRRSTCVGVCVEEEVNWTRGSIHVITGKHRSDPVLKRDRIHCGT